MWKKVLDDVVPKLAEYLQNEYHVKWVLRVKFMSLCIISLWYVWLVIRYFTYVTYVMDYLVSVYIYSHHIFQEWVMIYYCIFVIRCSNIFVKFFLDDWLHYSTHERIPSSVSVSNGGCILFFSSVLNNCESLPSFAYFITCNLKKRVIEFCVILLWKVPQF